MTNSAKMSIQNHLDVCRGCFYYIGVADNAEIPHNVGRHLCGCVNGRYDSGAAARYIDELAACPCAKWDDNNTNSKEM